MSTNDVVALALAGTFTVVCLVLAWVEHRRPSTSTSPIEKNGDTL
ncbi:hypothetical protein Sme01_54120 [Sphaerisporangium melleum]|uniref:Uncharacterized protein n=1 Tax=Sphaerisporangium melleum TaxID=321316 RepID=A0A917R6B9_9ACTN|nr:hypothetical protein [Sphaerisporangium melleum]GGK91786.1 hypothetical protein GCM10007964_37980 [Sphaerisporangium melleum]GII72936.1 hypothetical protein Sme01_54120 [Sphaerisporangium melleum]